MTNTEFYTLMKKDLKRFVPEKKEDVMSKGESKELTKAMRWVRRPLTPNIVNEFAKEYRMKPEDFEDYAHRFKTLYEGK